MGESKLIKKAFKLRLYPTKEQERKMWQHVGSCRFVWNYMLALQEERYKAGEKHLSGFDMNKMLTPLKNDGEHNWLYEVSNRSLQITCSDLADAYNMFFKKKHKHPKFKSRKTDRPSFPVDNTSFYFKDERHCNIQKIGKVKVKTKKSFPIGNKVCKFYNPRVSYDEAKKRWIIAFAMDVEVDQEELTDKLMGVDLGVKDLANVAFGDENVVFHNINKSKRVRSLEKKKRHIQRNISRKYEASKKRTGRYEKTNGILREEQKLREVQARLNGIRQNYTHQVTHKLVSMLPEKITMEDLNVSGMMKNKHLARSISEQRFHEFLRQMEYKCDWNGIELVKADRFYPSSKTCSSCGSIKKDLKLSDRTYVCPECGLTIDRDYNAAINLQKYVAGEDEAMAYPG